MFKALKGKAAAALDAAATTTTGGGGGNTKELEAKLASMVCLEVVSVMELVVCALPVTTIRRSNRTPPL